MKVPLTSAAGMIGRKRAERLATEGAIADRAGRRRGLPCPAHALRTS